MSDRLQALQGELQSVLDERMGELRAAIENAESATKAIVSAELEIARNQADRGWIVRGHAAPND